MKSIAWVNIESPSSEEYIEYDSKSSLRDYDIVVIDPNFPYYSRINFSGGGSCIDIQDSKTLQQSISHWRSEISGALSTGKTVFIRLNALKEDSITSGYDTGPKNSRTYKTHNVNNYSAIPGNYGVKNTIGRRIIVKDQSFKHLYEAMREITEYRVVLEPQTSTRTTLVAKDGACIGGVVRFEKWPGALVLLPYFDFGADVCIESDDLGQKTWSNRALHIFHAITTQLINTDRMLKAAGELSIAPDWLKDFASPKSITDIDAAVAEIDAQIEHLRHEKEVKIRERAELLEYSHLLYETGKPLENSIEKALRLLGYKVETLRDGDLEIDHVIIGPSGKRMIGESEGKDTSAIDISKFRQLESNIGEDFEREAIEHPAKGVLFGNGFRLSNPGDRADQFTKKSLTNASRLGSALVRTADLYAIAVHVLDHPDDEAFKAACRDALEETVGGIVQFPKP